MWSAFNGPIPKGMCVNHISEVKTDNRLSNLNLMTFKENTNWGTGKKRMINNRIGKTKKRKVVQYDLNGNLIKEYESISEIRKLYSYSGGNICECCKNNRKSAYGYIWRYN